MHGKSEQVQSMRQSFGTVVGVISWLGKYPVIFSIHLRTEAPKIRDIFHFLVSRPQGQLWEAARRCSTSRTIREVRTQEPAEALSDDSLLFLRDILSRPYFRRLWIVQSNSPSQGIDCIAGLYSDQLA